jgi:hypothetical protein
MGGGKMRKILTSAVVLSAVLMLSAFCAPAYAGVKGTIMDYMQMKFYSSGADLYTALKLGGASGGVDIAGFTLTYAQYLDAAADPNLITCPITMMNQYDLSPNANATIPTYPNWRNPLNYTEFKQAIACCVDKNSLIQGPTLMGRAHRIDECLPIQLKPYTNYNCTYYDANDAIQNLYPWEYSLTHALQILYANGWYDTSTYHTYTDVYNAYQAGTLLADAGKAGGCIYPPGHTKAGQPLDPLICYARTELDARRQEMYQVTQDLLKLGIPSSVTYGYSSVTWPHVYGAQDYQLYTGGIGAGTIPTWLVWFNSSYEVVGTYAIWGVHDSLADYWANMFYSESKTVAQAIEAAKELDYLQVTRVYDIPVWVPSTYFAYRKGICNLATQVGFGLFYSTDHTFLTSYSQDYPTVNTLYFGTGDVPTSPNPMFVGLEYDAQVIQRIFTFPLLSNPYMVGLGKTPIGGDIPWMAYDWNTTIDPITGNVIATLWFRHNIDWEDGVPFTVDDLNESIALYQYYDDSPIHVSSMYITKFVKLDQWTCQVYFNTPSLFEFDDVLAGMTIVPKHIYGFTNALGLHHPAPGSPTFYSDGPHGMWPWHDDSVTPVADPATVWVGCNMWSYVDHSFVSGPGGGIRMVANPDFFLKEVPGSISWIYTWDSYTTQPSKGYFTVGLSDLVYLANAYGTTGIGGVPFKVPGSKGAWNPACDLAAPSGIVGLSDLVTLARNYGVNWGTDGEVGV